MSVSGKVPAQSVPVRGVASCKHRSLQHVQGIGSRDHGDRGLKHT